MTGRLRIALAATVLLTAACAAPDTRRGPSRDNLEQRAGLTARLVELHERHLAETQARHANGIASASELTAAEVALIDAQLRHLSAQALLEMAP